MSTPRNGRFAAEANYLPHYNDIQQITGTAILATIAVALAVAFIIIQRRRRRARTGHVPWSGVRAVACPRVALW
ncbi:hypothetical protein [Mycobacterium avium]|uniref:hypothetical protein n=1 Tax=Mycobacterium avium TaxID=1764 RepID=UPI000BAF1C10|nr:hypothetical protein [Mycobacterium avium]MDO2376591.1 hypothetical protein [Mycobacterium avium subsp. hominissuis]MDO2391897.1 hypothetical protein [Mycobacterium avium subsp. hominissuis]PBA01977.1 hypothetical protein CKJ74_07885 [Mycobacterium avium]PBA06896.1 hypothetical protein CKJ73_07770 [Mycobacterium avium]PBA77082.1 hypothetical protein CKJ75_08300 [Mycobacterium avium]